jgi:hypothetical protein
MDEIISINKKIRALSQRELHLQWISTIMTRYKNNFGMIVKEDRL